jgi:hypothetical protein
LISSEGRSSTLCGAPFSAGHCDGVAASAKFKYVSNLLDEIISNKKKRSCSGPVGVTVARPKGVTTIFVGDTR